MATRKPVDPITVKLVMADPKKNSVVYKGESPMGLAISFYVPNDIVRGLGNPATMEMTLKAI